MKYILAVLPHLVLRVQAIPAASGPEPVLLPVRRMDLPGAKIFRRGVPRQSLIDHSSAYLADVSIGSPPQRTALMVDTGSWITWVDEHRECQTVAMQRESCQSLPLYDRSASDPPPKRVPALDQVAQYGGGEEVSLEGYSDVFTWGGETKVVGQPFAVAKRANRQRQSVGVLGLGPDGEKGFDAGISNSSVVATMVQQGLIKSRLFSLALGATSGEADNTGSLIFGGVDRNRYSGSLFKTPILPLEQGLDSWRYWVHVSQISNNRPDSKPGYRGAASGWSSKFLVDSGTTGVYMAREIFNPLLADLGLTSSRRLEPDGFPVVNCKTKSAKGSIEFSIGTGSIKVPYSDLVHQTKLGNCYLAIGSAGTRAGDGDKWSILGMSFMKSAYTVFDWDNRALSFAQWADCGSPDLVAIGPGSRSATEVRGNCK